VAQDYDKAREWYEKAADKDSEVAMSNIGLLYDNGRGVAQDYGKAREWYEKAADKGNEVAMNNIGVLYENGRGVAQDYGKAREWFEKAADKGNAVAMSNIGLLYENGRGVARDYGKAREWYEKAVEKGDVSANARLKGLPIKAAFAAGRYAEALQLQQVAASEEEAVETERNGKPGEATAAALQRVAWYALFAGEYVKALAVAERSHALFPDNLGIETNRAHALMFIGRERDAQLTYLAYKGKRLLNDASWESVIADDFSQFRNAGLTHPMMAEIEDELGISR